MRWFIIRRVFGLVGGMWALGALAIDQGVSDNESGNAAAVEPAIVERGRYIVRVAGCNDCHTRGYLMSDGNVPETQWLSGDDFGWHGPWGTTYGTNLRLFFSDLTEEQWITVARTLKRRPPMPWFNLNHMSDDDLKAIYQFARSLGAPGVPAPAALPPGTRPSTPFADFSPTRSAPGR